MRRAGALVFLFSLSAAAVVINVDFFLFFSLFDCNITIILHIVLDSVLNNARQGKVPDNLGLPWLSWCKDLYCKVCKARRLPDLSCKP